MVGTRENNDFLLIFTKAKQTNTKQYKVDETNKIFWLYFQGVTANNFLIFHFIENEESSLT